MLAQSVSFSLSPSGSGSVRLRFTFDQSSALELSGAVWGWGGKDGRTQPSPHGLSPNPPLAGRLGGGASLQSSCARGRREGGWTARSGFGRGWGWDRCDACRRTQGGVLQGNESRKTVNSSGGNSFCKELGCVCECVCVRARRR